MQGKANVQLRDPQQRANQGKKPVAPGKDGKAPEPGKSKGKENGWRKGSKSGGTGGNYRNRQRTVTQDKALAPDIPAQPPVEALEQPLIEDISARNAFSVEGNSAPAPYLYSVDQYSMYSSTNIEAAMQAKQASMRPGMMQNMNLSQATQLQNMHPMASVMPMMSVNALNGINGNPGMIMTGNVMLSPFNGGMISDAGYYSHVPLLNFQARGQQMHPNSSMIGLMQQNYADYAHTVTAMTPTLGGVQFRQFHQQHPHMIAGSGGPSTAGGMARLFNGALIGEMRTEDILKASSPILTRCLVDMLREGETGRQRARKFFERIVQSKKADVYQYSVMLNACANSYEAETLMSRMERANIKPSEVTYQKLYKIYLRDARVEEAERVLDKMRKVMRAEGNAALPDDYTNRVLTDMLLEMVKEGDAAEKRAWELFNKIRCLNKANVIHYNVMLNTCRTTEDALKLLQQAREAGIEPSDRTCSKLAKMYIKEGCLPSHPGQLEAVMKGLKKTQLFGKMSPLDGDARECDPTRGSIPSAGDSDRGSEEERVGGEMEGAGGADPDEVARRVNASIRMLRKSSTDQGSAACADAGGAATAPPAASGPPGHASGSPEAGGGLLRGLREAEASTDFAPLSGPAGPH